MTKDLEKVADYRGKKAKERIESESRSCAWTDSPLIQKYYIHPTTSGHINANWFMWVKEQFFSEPVEKALSLGCGDGCN